MSDAPKNPPVYRHEIDGHVLYQATARELAPGQRFVERGHFLPAEDARRLVEALRDGDKESDDNRAAWMYRDALTEVVARLGLDAEGER